jgi:hypothetical protein
MRKEVYGGVGDDAVPEQFGTRFNEEKHGDY